MRKLSLLLIVTFDILSNRVSGEDNIIIGSALSVPELIVSARGATRGQPRVIIAGINFQLFSIISMHSTPNPSVNECADEGDSWFAYVADPAESIHAVDHKPQHIW